MYVTVWIESIQLWPPKRIFINEHHLSQIVHPWQGHACYSVCLFYWLSLYHANVLAVETCVPIARPKTLRNIYATNISYIDR